VKRNLARHVLGLILLLATLGHAAQLYRIDLIDRLEAIFYDAKLRLTMPRGIDERIAIIDIDEKSLAEQGRWPWGRDRLALLMDQLFDHYGIRLAGVDVVFAEPDISSGIKSLESLSKHDLRDDAAFQGVFRALRPKLDYDARFAASLKNRKVILGYYFSNIEDGKSSGVLPEPTFAAGSFADKRIEFRNWLSFGGNLERLQSAAAGAGHFNLRVDFDGIARRVPLLAEYGGAYYESLALAMVQALLDFPPIVPGYADSSDRYAGLEWLELKGPSGRLSIPVDEEVTTLIPYRGPQGSFPYYSATDVMNGRVATNRLKDRIVLIGTTAPGLLDLRATPVSTAYPGVEAHANLVAGMLDGNIKNKPSYMLAVEVVQVFVAGILLIILLPALSPLKATLTGSVVLLGLTGINLYLWDTGNLVAPFASAAALAILLYALNMSWGYFVESKTKRQFTELFGQYVPPELVDEMSKNPEGYSMNGRKAELTVLFSDIRGFTTISEGLQPDQLATLMNEYLGAMTEEIRKQRGTLDKYIGDAIMAFWGAPVEDTEHARHAVITALEMQAVLKDLNRHLIEKGWPELKIGVGVNTGMMTVGDMGSPVRKAYTVMGDAVNLGSRLEGITKQYGVGIILGEDTRERMGDGFVLRELDRVRVKGKDKPVGIYEPLGRIGQVTAETIEDVQRWNEALQAYRAQDWDRAEKLLSNLAHNRPHYLYDLYATRIVRYRENPPGADWDGVTTFETK